MFQLRPDFYVQVWRDRVHVENLTTGRQAEEPIEHPHSRVLFGDFYSSEKALKEACRKVGGRWFWQWPHTMLMHIQEELGHDVSSVELRAVRDIAAYAGAKVVFIIREPVSLSTKQFRELLAGGGPPELMSLRTQ